MSEIADRIFLIGFMGSGKSSVGRALADQLDWEFVDTDALIEQREGRSIDAIFRDSGEGYFRTIEWEVLESLGRRSRCVVATGGGAFLGSRPRRWMKRSGWTIWLDVSLETAASRVGEGGRRPLWLPDDPLEFRAFFEGRKAVYALAHLTVDAGSGDANEVARSIRSRVPRVFR